MAPPAATLPELFFNQVERLGDSVALRRKDLGVWNEITWRQYGSFVEIAAAGMAALGVNPGDRIAVLGENRPEWLYCHLGCMSLGGATSGIYPTSAADQIAYEVDHSESKILFVENEEQVDKVLQIIDSLQLTKVVVWEEKGLWGFTHEKFIFFDEFLESGRKYLQEHPDFIKRSMGAIKPDDTAMMIYTSGTTGRPKAAQLTHRNILFITEGFIDGMPKYDDPNELLSYLPLAHIYENLVSVFMAIWQGSTVNFVESIDTLGQNLREVSPTVFCSVPRIWEKFASAIRIRMDDSTWFKRVCFKASMAVALKYVKSPEDSFQRFKWGLLYKPAYWLVLHHLKRQLGFERVRWAICGAAPASADLFRFYNALGVPLLEGYGQTESTGIIAFQRLGRARLGYVGEPIRGFEVKIADDGEILCKGDGVFKGYFKDPDLTREAIQDGWLHTGDVGALEDGLLKIMDRKKDILITAGGKNVTPAYIENKLKFSDYIQDAVVIGDGRKYLVAVILIDEDNVTKYAQDNRVPFTTFEDLTKNPEIHKLIGREVATVNKDVARVETIKKFALLPRRFYEEDGDVTPTKKVKRRFIEQRYKDVIESLYK